MPKVVSRIQTFVALLLLVVGQLSAIASAQGATCPRAALRHAALVVPSGLSAPGEAVSTAIQASARVDEHQHHTPSPSGLSGVAPGSCQTVLALSGRFLEHPLPGSQSAPAFSRGESPPGHLLISAFFRPPRLI